MKKLGMIFAGVLFSVAMAVTMIPTTAMAKVKVSQKNVKGVVYIQNDKTISTTGEIKVTNTKVAKKKGVTTKITCTLSSDKPEVVKVAKDGTLTFLGKGSATITVKETVATTKKVNGKKKTTKATSTATVKVTVTEEKLKSDVECSCGCDTCKSGDCNVIYGCYCDCDDCVFGDYEDGELIVDDEDDYDDDSDEGYIEDDEE